MKGNDDYIRQISFIKEANGPKNHIAAYGHTVCVRSSQVLFTKLSNSRRPWFAKSPQIICWSAFRINRASICVDFRQDNW